MYEPSACSSKTDILNNSLLFPRFINVMNMSQVYHKPLSSLYNDERWNNERSLTVTTSKEWTSVSQAENEWIANSRICNLKKKWYPICCKGVFWWKHSVIYPFHDFSKMFRSRRKQFSKASISSAGLGVRVQIPSHTV